MNVDTENYRWSLGTLIGMPVGILCGLLLLIGAVLILVWAHRNAEDYDSGIARWTGIGLAFCAVAAFALTLVGMWPLKAEYHQWRETSGAVTEIDSRLLADGNGGATERFVVTFDGGEQRSCDDTRCSQVEEGDDLVLACKRAWQWSGTHGYDCNYVSHRSAR